MIYVFFGELQFLLFSRKKSFTNKRLRICHCFALFSIFRSQIFIFNLQVWNCPKNSSRKFQRYLEDELFWKNSVDQIEVKHTLVCFDRNVAKKFAKTRPESLKDILKNFLDNAKTIEPATGFLHKSLFVKFNWKVGAEDISAISLRQSMRKY